MEHNCPEPPLKETSFVFEFGRFYVEVKLYSDRLTVSYIENNQCFLGTFDKESISGPIPLTIENVYKMFIKACNGEPAHSLQFVLPSWRDNECVSGICIKYEGEYFNISQMIDFKMKDDEALKSRYALYLANKRIEDLENQLKESKVKIRDVTDRCAVLEDKFETMARQIEKLTGRVETNSNSNSNSNSHNLPRTGSNVREADEEINIDSLIHVFVTPCGKIVLIRASEIDSLIHVFVRPCCGKIDLIRASEINFKHNCECRCESRHESNCECRREPGPRCEPEPRHRCECHFHCHCHSHTHCHFIPEYSGFRGYYGFPRIARGVQIRLDSRLPGVFEDGTHNTFNY